MDARRHGETVVTDLPGDRWLVTLAGDHDLSTADDLREKLRTIFRTGTTVVLDLSDTTFVDSSTLAVLMDADTFAQEHGCDRFGIVIVRESAPDRLFQLAGVHRVFTTFDSVDEAFAHFESAADAGTAERWRQRKQRIVKNEQAFRDYNDRRLAHESVDATDDQEPIPFICECGDKDCIEALLITAAEFTEAHSAPNRFIVKSGHVYQDVERIIAEERHSLSSRSTSARSNKRPSRVSVEFGERGSSPLIGAFDERCGTRQRHLLAFRTEAFVRRA